MNNEIDEKPKREGFLIPRKAIFGIAPAVAVLAVLISKGDIGPLLLFLVGVGAGILIGRGYFGK